VFSLKLTGNMGNMVCHKHCDFGEDWHLFMDLDSVEIED